MQEQANILPYVSPVGATVWNKRVMIDNPLNYFSIHQAIARSWLNA
jgi:hypothetical protein